MPPSTYFDSIPSEALSTLLRYLAKYPNIDRWVTTVNPSDALNVLNTNGALRAAAREEFRTLGKHDFWRIKSGISVSLLKAMAPKLKQLYLRRCFRGEYQFEHLPELRILEVSKPILPDFVDLVLEKCGANIIELRFYGSLKSSTIRSIGRYCSSVEILDCLIWREESNNLDLMLSSIGKTLRELHGRFFEDGLPHVAKHCFRLEKLKLKFFYNVISNMDTVPQLLRNLQSLKSMSFILNDFVPLDNFRAALEQSSPNMRIDACIQLSNVNSIVDYFDVLGNRLHALDVTLSGVLKVLPNYVLPQFWDLEKLVIDTSQFDNSSAIETIFSKPMPNLRHLQIKFWCGAVIDFLTLSRSASNLFEVHFIFNPKMVDRVKQNPVNNSDLLQFLLNNKNLRELYLFFGDINGEGLAGPNLSIASEMFDLIRKLGTHSSLSKIDVFFEERKYGSSGLSDFIYQTLPDACVSHRNKRTNILVNGKHYARPRLYQDRRSP